MQMITEISIRVLAIISIRLLAMYAKNPVLAVNRIALLEHMLDSRHDIGMYEAPRLC